jgi:alkaline phosphatase D
MIKRISRRQALIGVSSTLILPGCSTTKPRGDELANAVFAHGVASGDPDETSVVIWSRVDDVDSAVPVDWQVATDASFRTVVARGRVTTSAKRDHTVKVVASGLRPGRQYFYRFLANGVYSPTGRTRTLPAGHVDELVFAVASCSNYPFGYFNAYEVIANDDDIDFVVHLGDYIYEYDENGYGGEAGRRTGRIHEPRQEIVSLDDYRTRHAQYKSDEGSLAMHASHPLIAIWDDHESANNPWMGGAQNHQPDEGDWFARRAASLKAWYEWMPVRDPAPGMRPEQYWRHYRFGDLASLITLESRHTGRSKQIDWGDLSRFRSAADAQAWYRDVVGADDRTYLSAAMEDFLAGALAESVDSGRRWRIIGNQSVMAKWVMPRLDDPYFRELRGTLNAIGQRTLDGFTKLGEFGLTGDLDAWGGYPVARERFYQIAEKAGARDLLVISGDSHGYWANALHDDQGVSVGVELGTTGITSPRFENLVPEAVHRYDRLMAQTNPEVIWCEGRYNGFIRLAIAQQGARADYVTVSNIESRDYETQVIRTARVAGADGTLRFS